MHDYFQQKPTSLSVTDAGAEICLNTNSKLQLTEPFLWVMTSIFESNDGQLIARVS
jgi:hypothetical protein